MKQLPKQHKPVVALHNILCGLFFILSEQVRLWSAGKFDVQRTNGRPRILDKLQAIIRSAAPAVYRSQLQKFLNNPLTKFHTRLRTEGGAMRCVIQIVGTGSKYVASPIRTNIIKLIRGLKGLQVFLLSTTLTAEYPRGRISYIKIRIMLYTRYTQKNGAVSKVNKKLVSRLTRAKRTSAVANVQVSRALITILQCVHPGSHDTHPHGNQIHPRLGVACPL
jgi:hypothetical protein